MKKLSEEKDLITDRLDQLATVALEGEVLEDLVGWLASHGPEDLNLRFLDLAHRVAPYFRWEDWSDFTAWQYHTPEIVAGSYDLNKLPSGAIRERAKELYY